MKAIALFVFVGLVSVVLVEVVGVTIMTLLPPSIDVVGNYYLMVFLPAVLIVAVLGGLILTRQLRTVSFGKSLIYPASFAVLQFVVLGLFFNPLETRISSMVTTAVVTVLVVLWRRRQSQKG